MNYDIGKFGRHFRPDLRICPNLPSGDPDILQDWRNIAESDNVGKLLIIQCSLIVHFDCLTTQFILICQY
ncbi:hypothetical protein EUGRSUZ_A01067 [Eucalyptus grandis]|uniref:Uncharacterized protein n=2 Tax=Eucalyptus grandis TaxID=71139 RepID=A0ACC3M3E0_EUCGR|nr:hypothetical protein EUGRSUZ_A01067 [Eucalyptus grandis]